FRPDEGGRSVTPRPHSLDRRTLAAAEGHGDDVRVAAGVESSTPSGAIAYPVEGTVRTFFADVLHIVRQVLAVQRVLKSRKPACDANALELCAVHRQRR